MSPYAAELLRWMLDPPREGACPYPESHRLSDEDLGTLLAGAFRATEPRGAIARYGIEELARERQPRFTTAACDEMLRAIAQRALRGMGEPGQATHALLRTADPWPPDVAKICAWLAKEYKYRASRTEQIHSLLALLAIAG